MNQSQSTSSQLPIEGDIISVNNIQLYYEKYGEGTPHRTISLNHISQNPLDVWRPRSFLSCVTGSGDV